MLCPVGADDELVNEVNTKRQLPIGSKPCLDSGEDVTANMSETRRKQQGNVPLALASAGV